MHVPAWMLLSNEGPAQMQLQRQRLPVNKVRK